MSRYGPDPRYSTGNVGYRDSPPRWDSERFVRERDVRYSVGGPPVLERERPYEGYGRRMEERFSPPPPRRESQVPRFEERIYADERYGPPARRVERQYYEEEDVYDPRGGGAMIPYSPQRYDPPPRPGLIRRQSSLDTFDRRPSRRFEEYDREEVRGPPMPRPQMPVPLPPAPPRYGGDPRYAEGAWDERDYRYKEREWSSFRRGSDSREREREEEVIEEVGEVEKPYPRRGKTRMPRRLVHTKALYDLGYTYYEEDDMIIIEKALGKENIDEVVALTKRYRDSEVTTVHMIEAPPPQIREEKIVETKIETFNINDAPRSVREWDHLSVRSPSPRHRSRSRHRSKSRHGSPPEKIIDVHRDSITVREVSPARTQRSSRSRRRSSVSRAEVIERREIITDDFDESNSIAIGPLALVVDDRRKSRSDRDIRAEIRELEDERQGLRRERRDRDVIKVERIENGDRIIEREVEVKKDKKAPSAGLMRAMLATLT